MKDPTRQEAVDKILLVMCNYYAQALTRDVIDLYHQLLAEYSIGEIRAAAAIYMKENRWFPKANELIEIIEKNRGPQVSIEARALTQWRVVLQQLKRHGAYHPPKFTDPVTNYLIKNQFSWSYLSNMKEDEENWEQKRWCEAFALMAEDHQDLVALDVPEKTEILELVNKVASDVSDHIELTPAGGPVSIDKITAYKKMLESQARKDEKELEKTNKRIDRIASGE